MWWHLKITSSVCYLGMRICKSRCWQVNVYVIGTALPLKLGLSVIFLKDHYILWQQESLTFHLDIPQGWQKKSGKVYWKDCLPEIPVYGVCLDCCSNYCSTQRWAPLKMCGHLYLLSQTANLASLKIDRKHGYSSRVIVDKDLTNRGQKSS